MQQIVLKFGGTSVRTAHALSQVLSIVKSTDGVRAIVVSALAGVTDQLWHIVHLPQAQRMVLLESIIKIHLDLLKDLNLPIEYLLRPIFDQLITILGVEAIIPECIDDVLAIGEDLSSKIVGCYLQSQGVNLIHYDARLFLKTDMEFQKANPLWPHLLSHSYPQQLFITQGFIGQSLDGRTTTLGRGGSDYTAALLAAAIKADSLCIYTDVPGVYTTDPKKDFAAKWISFLSFESMEKMAYAGAKVLHPLSVKPCQKANIPIYVLSTFEPHKPGTKIAAA